MQFQNLVDYLVAMQGCFSAMPQIEKDEYLEWERVNLDGHSIGSADWPGWEKYIGKKPLPQPRQERSKQDGFVYLMRNARNGLTKIGYSVKPKVRENCLQSEEPEIRLLAMFRGTGANEKELHRMFHGNRIRGEWFNLSDEQIATITKGNLSL